MDPSLGIMTYKGGLSSLSWAEWRRVGGRHTNIDTHALQTNTGSHACHTYIDTHVDIHTHAQTQIHMEA